MSKMRALAISLLLISLSPAAAEDSPAPRRPVGPQGRVMELQTPQETLPMPAQPPSNDSIRIQNVGDQRLALSYWDGESAWRPLSIEAGKTADLSCQKCAGQITVAFHNGKAMKQVKVQSGRVYLLGWSDTGGVWELTSSR